MPNSCSFACDGCFSTLISFKYFFRNILFNINFTDSFQPMTKNKIVYREFGAPEPENNSDSPAVDLPPQQQNLRIQASRKGRKGKTVTVVSGFQTSPENLTSLVKQLKNYCGAGGTIKENEIEIQGDCVQKTLQFLLKLGYKAKISGG